MPPSLDTSGDLRLSITLVVLLILACGAIDTGAFLIKRHRQQQEMLEGWF